jgi:hypothetical protein
MRFGALGMGWDLAPLGWDGMGFGALGMGRDGDGEG